MNLSGANIQGAIWKNACLSDAIISPTHERSRCPLEPLAFPKPNNDDNEDIAYDVAL